MEYYSTKKRMRFSIICDNMSKPKSHNSKENEQITQRKTPHGIIYLDLWETKNRMVVARVWVNVGQNSGRNM